MKNKYKIAVIGLGYVGLPLACLFSKKYSVHGYDVDENRVSQLRENYDKTNEISEQILVKQQKGNLKITSSILEIKDCNIFMVTVPTPVLENKKPDLSFLMDASKDVSKLLKKGDIVIYESTVYPGCTEEVCVPILEKGSHLIYNKDFFCGYSPERINPGDKLHTVDKNK